MCFDELQYFLSELQLMESLPFESQCPIEEPNIVKLLYETQLKKVIVLLIFQLGVLF